MAVTEKADACLEMAVSVRQSAPFLGVRASSFEVFDRDRDLLRKRQKNAGTECRRTWQSRNAAMLYFRVLCERPAATILLAAAGALVVHWAEVGGYEQLMPRVFTLGKLSMGLLYDTVNTETGRSQLHAAAAAATAAPPPHTNGAVAVVPKTSHKSLQEEHDRERPAPSTMRSTAVEEILRIQTLLSDCIRKHAGELSLPSQHIELLIENLFVTQYDAIYDDEDTIQRTRQTRAKVIASVGIEGNGNARHHQDWASRSTVVLALCVSRQTCGSVVLTKLRPSYMRLPQGRANDNKRLAPESAVGKMEFPCGSIHGSALTMVCEENEGWLHGTDLHIDVDDARLMMQITGHVMFGKSAAVMAIWRRELLGDEVEGTWTPAPEALEV